MSPRLKALICIKDVLDGIEELRNISPNGTSSFNTHCEKLVKSDIGKGDFKTILKKIESIGIASFDLGLGSSGLGWGSDPISISIYDWNKFDKYYQETAEEINHLYKKINRPKGHDERQETPTSGKKKIFDFVASTPIGSFYWGNFIKLVFKRPISLFRKILFIIVIAVVIVFAVLCVKSVFTEKSYFIYDFFGKTYQARDINAPTIIDTRFEGKVKNISSEKRYLEYIHYTLWNNKTLGRTWDYGYGFGEIYEVKEENKEQSVILPLIFEPNEVKQLIFKAEIKVNDKEIFNAYGEREGNIRFNWPKNEIELLFEDSRGNIFDESGKLISALVRDLWWELPNNRTFLSKTLGYTDLFKEILVWRIKRFFHFTH